MAVIITYIHVHYSFGEFTLSHNLYTKPCLLRHDVISRSCKTLLHYIALCCNAGYDSTFCTSLSDGPQPDPGDCTGYYICQAGGVFAHVSCDTGAGYDYSSSQNCLPLGTFTCYGDVGVPTETSGEEHEGLVKESKVGI